MGLALYVVVNNTMLCGFTESRTDSYHVCTIANACRISRRALDWKQYPSLRKALLYSYFFRGWAPTSFHSSTYEYAPNLPDNRDRYQLVFDALHDAFFRLMVKHPIYAKQICWHHTSVLYPLFYGGNRLNQSSFNRMARLVACYLSCRGCAVNGSSLM